MSGVIPQLSPLSMRALLDVGRERIRQEEKCLEHRDKGWLTCADPDNDDGTRLSILGEEFGEVARTMCDERVNEYAAGPIENRGRALEHRREELVQLCAVAVAWIEAIDAETA